MAPEPRLAPTVVGLEGGVEPRPGVSVVVPSYRGRRHIYACLRSLGIQHLDPGEFEVVVVLNGEPDGTKAELDRFRAKFPRTELRVLEIPQASAAIARNAGISASRRHHVTFVDDDDTVSPAYLTAMLAQAEPGVIPVAHIVDIDPTGRAEPDNRISHQLIPYAGRTVHPSTVPRALSFNSCKLIPRNVADAVRYDPVLRSGDDIDFYMRLIVSHDFDLSICQVNNGPAAVNAVYYRRLRGNSLSRQVPSFVFSVTERMEVISRLDALAEACEDEWRREFILIMLRGQASYIRRYVEAHPDELRRILDTVESFSVANFPYRQLTTGLAKSLVISYCFVPYSDTSAVVMAKRVRERGEIVDIVYNAMDAYRSLDLSTMEITRGMIDREIRVSSPSGFSSWRAVAAFCKQGIAHIEQIEAAGKSYERLYSRVNWPASHFLAAVCKARRPELWWSAEFSDPVSHGVDGKERLMKMSDGSLLTRLKECLRAAGFPAITTRNGFRWCEYLAFALADEVLFTNDNQMEYMLSYCEHPELVDRVRAIARVEAHPTLPARFYRQMDSDYHLAGQQVNVAYFGAFYATRGLDPVLVAMSELEPKVRSRLRLHVFTAQESELRSRADELGVGGQVEIRDYVPYLEFLSLTRRFDWLVVNDAVTAGTHPCNPYLPSKISDYLGSGARIWGLVEKDSVLSRMPLDHSNEVGDIPGAVSFLRRIAQPSLPHREEGASPSPPGPVKLLHGDEVSR